MGKLAKQSVVGSVFVSLGFLLGSIASIFIYPKVCSKEELGQFKLIMNWAMIFSQFMSIGVGTLANRYLPQHRQKKSEGELNYIIFVFPTVASIIFTMAFLPVSLWFLNSISDHIIISTWLAVMLLISFSVMQTYIKVYTGLSIALKQADKNFFVNELVIRFLFLMCFIAFFLNLTRYEGMLVLIGVSQLIQLFLILYLVRHFILKNKIKRPSRKALNENLGYGLYATFDSGANALVGRLDIIMIGFLMLNANKYAQEYDMAFSIATMVYLPFRSVNTSATPYLAEAFQQNDIGKINRLYQQSSISLYLVGLVLFTFIFINVDDLIKIIPGDYSAIKYPIFVLCIAKILDMLTSVNNTILLLSPYFRLNLVFNLFLVALTILTNWLLVPVYGILGSAIATAITIVCFNILKGGFLYSKYKLAPFHNKTFEVTFFIGIIFGAMIFFPSITGNAFIDIAIRSAACALAVYFYLILFKPSADIEKLRVNALKRLKLIRSNNLVNYK